jgi:hypothetical protein
MELAKVVELIHAKTRRRIKPRTVRFFWCDYVFFASKRTGLNGLWKVILSDGSEKSFVVQRDSNGNVSVASRA